MGKHKSRTVNLTMLTFGHLPKYGGGGCWWVKRCECLVWRGPWEQTGVCVGDCEHSGALVGVGQISPDGGWLCLRSGSGW